jgi:hypothetical protein
MRSRIVAALLVAAAVLYACGPRSHGSEPAFRQRGVNGPLVASSLGVTVGNGVNFVMHVTNNAEKRLELTFPSGRTHDLVVLDSAGREVWRWSEGRMFTQAVQNRILESSETLSYEVAWKPEQARGTFVAVASLESDNHPLERRVEFAIP